MHVIFSIQEKFRNYNTTSLKQDFITDNTIDLKIKLVSDIDSNRPFFGDSFYHRKNVTIILQHLWNTFLLQLTIQILKKASFLQRR